MNKVSIIVPVYKVEKYLDRCVESIVNQTYKNLEIILVDDGSPDNCPKMCDEWVNRDSRIKVLHKLNEGVSKARNEGLKVSTGDYIAFVDSDDYVDNTYIEDMLFENADVVVSGLRMINVSTGKIKEYQLIKKHYSSATEFYDVVFAANCFNSPCNKLYKSSIIKQLAFNLNFNIGEDAMFNIKVLEKSSNLYSVNKTNYNYELGNNENSLSKNEKMVNRFKSCLEQIKMLKDSFYKKFSPEVCCRYMVILFCDMRNHIKHTQESKKEVVNLLDNYRNNIEIINIIKNAKTKGLKQKVVKMLMKIKNTKLFYSICKMV